MTPTAPEELDFPANWDRIDERAEQGQAPESASALPPLISLMAAAWGDLVAILAVCTASLLTLLGLGHSVSLPCLPWSCGLALLWWCASAAVLLTVRRGTPGMLMAGVVFRDNVATTRLAAVLAAATVLMLTLGLPALLGPRRSWLRRAGGSDLVCSGDLG